MYIRQLNAISDKAFLKKLDKVKEVFRLARKYHLSEFLIEEVAEHIKVTKRNDGWGKWQTNLEYWWTNVAWYQSMSEEFIISNIHTNLSWKALSCNQSLTEEFIEKYCHELYWSNLCKYVPLSEKLMDKLAHRLDWKNACRHQELSEQFIIKHQKKIEWVYLMDNHHLSKDFFERNKHLITVKLYATDLVKIIERQRLSEETLKEVKKGKMAWSAISQSATLTRDFVISNYDKLDTWKVRYNHRTDREVREEVELIEKLSGN